MSWKCIGRDWDVKGVAALQLDQGTLFELVLMRTEIVLSAPTLFGKAAHLPR